MRLSRFRCTLAPYKKRARNCQLCSKAQQRHKITTAHSWINYLPLGTNFWFKDLNRVKWRTGSHAIIERSERFIGHFSVLQPRKHDKNRAHPGTHSFRRGREETSSPLHFGLFYSLAFLQKSIFTTMSFRDMGVTLFFTYNNFNYLGFIYLFITCSRAFST